MVLKNFRHNIERLLSFVDVKIDGDRPWDLKVHNEDLYARLLAEGSLGLGESYMDGWWECNRLDEFINRILRAKLDERVKPWSGLFGILKAKLFNFQKPSRAFQIGQHHYDIGNNLQGLPVEIRLQDYRGLEGAFDRILSLGMFEHVGYKNYVTFMRVVNSYLKDVGLFVLHTIGGNVSVTRIDPWIERYIFPNSMLPSARQICSAAEGLFVLEDWHSFGADYDKTLIHWFRNFHDNWDALKEEYDERFYRMWKYYLLSCAGSFRARINQMWQIVLSPEGIPGGYQATR